MDIFKDSFFLNLLERGLKHHKNSKLNKLDEKAEKIRIPRPSFFSSFMQKEDNKMDCVNNSKFINLFLNIFSFFYKKVEKYPSSSKFFNLAKKSINANIIILVITAFIFAVSVRLLIELVKAAF